MMLVMSDMILELCLSPIREIKDESLQVHTRLETNNKYNHKLQPKVQGTNRRSFNIIEMYFKIIETRCNIIQIIVTLGELAELSSRGILFEHFVQILYLMTRMLGEKLNEIANGNLVKKCEKIVETKYSRFNKDPPDICASRATASFIESISN